MTTSDVSVRIAWSADAAAIAELQLRTWPEQYAGVVPASAFPTGPGPLEAATTAWAESLTKPADARNRALVALAHDRVVGFAIVGPASDPDCDPIADGELHELAVGPDDRGLGHGSRLLQAAAETMAADRFTRAVTWLPVGTDPSDRARAFLQSAGWGPDGAHRELDLDGTGAVRVKQVRLHTSLAGLAG